MSSVVEFLVKIKDHMSAPLDQVTRKARGARRALDEITETSAKTDKSISHTGKSLHDLENRMRRLHQMRTLIPADAEHQLGRINKLIHRTNEEMARMKTVGMPTGPGGGGGAGVVPGMGGSRRRNRMGAIKNFARGIPGLGGLMNPYALAGTAILGGTAYSIKQGAQQEYDRKQFTNAYGGGRGASLFDDLKGQKGSLGEGTMDMGRRLADSGMGNKETIDTLRRLGDVANGSEEKMAGLVDSIAGLKKEGKLTTDVLSALESNGLTPLELISRHTGESFNSLFDRLDKGKITAQEVMRALREATDKGGEFYANLDNLDDTKLSRWKRLSEYISQAAANLGEYLLTAGERDIKRATGLWDDIEASTKNAFGFNVKDVGDAIGNSNILTPWKPFMGEDEAAKVAKPFESRGRPVRDADGDKIIESRRRKEEEARRAKAAEDKKQADRINAVSGGGVRNVTINITKMIETINNNIQNGNGKQMVADMEKMVAEAMVRTLASVSAK